MISNCFYRIAKFVKVRVFDIFLILCDLKAIHELDFSYYYELNFYLE